MPPRASTRNKTVASTAAAAAAPAAPKASRKRKAKAETDDEDEVAVAKPSKKKTKVDDEPEQQDDDEEEDAKDAPAVDSKPTKMVTVVKRGAAPVDPECGRVREYHNLIYSELVYFGVLTSA